MKESVKWLVEWATYHFISREIWYPLPENMMKLEELKFLKQNKEFINIIADRKKRNARVGIIIWCCCSIKKWKAGNYNRKEQNFPWNGYYEELKPINDADKKYSDEHESDSEILQYDSDEASLEWKEIDNEESLSLRRVFETSNENLFLIGRSSRLGRRAKFNRRYLHWFYE